MDRGRRSRGTSLIEILVVIVVLLVGILAVVQIFPRGFRLLVLSRNTTMATALARALGENLVARPDEIPDQILPIRWDATLGQNVLLTDRTPNDLGPVASSVDSNGHLILAGKDLGDWQLQSGSNVYRRIIGEAHTIPTPRTVGTMFGALLVLPHGPIDFHNTANPNFAAYGDDLVRRSGVSDAINERGAPDDRYFDTLDESQDYEYFVRLMSAPTVGQIYLPTSDSPRDYIVRYSGYVGTPANYSHRDFSFPVHVDATTRGTFFQPQASNFPLFRYEFGGAEANQVTNLLSVDADSIRVARAFTPLQVATPFDDGQGGRPVDPYEYKLIDSATGVLLFNPVAYNVTTPTPTGRKPLRAKVDYDVYDWRVLHEDFRIGDGPEYQLSVPSLKVGSQAGPDGRPNGSIQVVEPGTPTSFDKADNFVLQDLETGGLYYERFNNVDLIKVDKSRGIVTLNDSNAVKPLRQAMIRYPDGTDAEVDIDGRSVRAFYRSRQEWAVQFLKGASQYNIAYARPTAAEFYVGGSAVFGGFASRIYFSPSDAGRKVNIGQLRYLGAGNEPKTASGQDFVIRFIPGDPLGLPCIDISKDIDKNFQAFDFSHGTPAREVKGASLTVRVTWNPDSFTLSSGENISRLETWGRGTRHSTTDTYLQRGDNIR